MWRAILAVILLPSLTAAQSAQTAAAPPARSEEPKETFPPPTRFAESPYQPYTYYDAIRRGTTEQVAVQVSALFLTMPVSPVAGIVPLSLELQPAEGFTISRLRYPKAHPRKFKFRSEPLRVADLPLIQFKVHADQNATLGTKVLTGKLTYQGISVDSGVGPVQQVEVAIPIKVVDRSVSVRKTGYPFPPMPLALMIVLIVLLAPVAIVVWPLCMISGLCGD